MGDREEPPLKEGVRVIEWARFSPRVQGNRRCQYCGEIARYMRQQGLKGVWTALCERHARAQETT